jgi:hypothetical protein
MKPSPGASIWECPLVGKSQQSKACRCTNSQLLVFRDPPHQTLTRIFSDDTVPLGYSKRRYDEVFGGERETLADATKWKKAKRHGPTKKENLDLEESAGKLKMITQYLSCDAGESRYEMKALAEEQLKRMYGGKSLKKTVTYNANGTFVWKYLCRYPCCPLLILLREEYDSDVSIGTMGFRYIIEASTASMKGGLSQDDHSHAAIIEDEHDKN